MQYRKDYIIIGSKAIHTFYMPFRTLKDIDVLVSDSITADYCKKILGYDTILIAKHILDSIPYRTYAGEKYATPDAVFTLKCSHLGWDIFFNKHKMDVLYLKSKGCILIKELYYTLVSYWKEVNGNKEFLNFYQTKENFFNDYVNYIYDHDYLHEVISYPDKPLYLDCRYDGEEVAIDPKKFYALSEEKQIQFFREEITVIAAERWLIPKLSKKYNYTQAYELAFHKMLISLTKDWQTDMIIFNIEKLVKPDIKLFNKLKNKGIIEMSENLSETQIEELYKAIIAAINREIFLGENFSLRDYYIDSIKDYAEQIKNDWDNLDFSDITNNLLWEIPDVENASVEFRTVEQKGGEGEGEYAYTVLFFHDKTQTKEGKYYLFEYSYYSYNGYDFDCMTAKEVEPVTESVTVYK